ncbi:hypothetical protein PM082_005258 [Marasmius tenuissimus]|nr:hypothetical protein PM082_005258 [Marasmius tenuissimus]
MSPLLSWLAPYDTRPPFTIHLGFLKGVCRNVRPWSESRDLTYGDGRSPSSSLSLYPYSSLTSTYISPASRNGQ